MNIYFLISGILCFLLGISHSILGEYLIFNSKRDSGALVPTLGDENLKERHLRILWATWHLASVFGWCIGVILIKFSVHQSDINLGATELIVWCIVWTMLFSSLIVFTATNGKHPGWIVLLVIGVLLLTGNL